MVQWRHLCCVRWVKFRLKEPKRSCWTCEAISHKYDPQRNDEEERLGRLTQKILPPWLHPRLCEPGYIKRCGHLANDNRSLYWRSLPGYFWNCSLTLCHRVAGQKFQTGEQINVDFFFGWKCHCISLFSYFFFLFLLSAWSLPKQVSCSLRGHTYLSGNGFVHWCKWRTSCQSICPSQFHQLGSLHQEALQNK